MLSKLKNLLGVFLAAVLLMTLMYHLTKLYGTKNLGVAGIRPGQRRHLYGHVLGGLGAGRVA